MVSTVVPYGIAVAFSLIGAGLVWALRDRAKNPVLLAIAGPMAGMGLVSTQTRGELWKHGALGILLYLCFSFLLFLVPLVVANRVVRLKTQEPRDPTR